MFNVMSSSALMTLWLGNIAYEKLVNEKAVLHFGARLLKIFTFNKEFPLSNELQKTFFGEPNYLPE